jgi:hypothetical protein
MMADKFSFLSTFGGYHVSSINTIYKGAHGTHGANIQLRKSVTKSTPRVHWSLETPIQDKKLFTHIIFRNI